MKVTGILLAAGASRRMGRDKLIISLGGRTVLRRSAEALLNAGVTDIIIAVSDATRQEAEALCAQYGLRTVNGGETRGDSVYNALRAADCDIFAPGTLLLITAGTAMVAARIASNCWSANTSVFPNVGFSLTW